MKENIQKAIIDGIKLGVVGYAFLQAGGDVGSVNAVQSKDGLVSSNPCKTARLNLDDPVSLIDGEYVANGDNGVAIRFNKKGQVSFDDSEKTVVQLLNEMRGGKKTGDVLSYSVQQRGEPFKAGRIQYSTRTPTKWCPAR